MLVFVILLLCDVIVAFIYAKNSYPTVDVKAFLLKMLASGIFVLSGVLAYSGSAMGAYEKLVMAALIFGLIGDALLSLDPFIKNDENQKRNNMIATILGAGFFLIGHILYMIAFVKEIKLREAFRLPVFLGFWLLGIGIAISATLILKLKHGKLTGPLFTYTIGLCAMGALSVNLALFGCGGNLLLQLMLVAAPILFMVSDSTLGLKFADNERFGTAKMRYLTLLTYYPAQMLFSFTIMLINK